MAGGTRATTADNGWAIGGREIEPRRGRPGLGRRAGALPRCSRRRSCRSWYERDADGVPRAGWRGCARADQLDDLAVLDVADARAVRRGAVPAGARGVDGRRREPVAGGDAAMARHAADEWAEEPRLGVGRWAARSARASSSGRTPVTATWRLRAPAGLGQASGGSTASQRVQPNARRKPSFA